MTTPDDHLSDCIAPLKVRAGELYRALADAGFRIFALSLRDPGRDRNCICLIHDHKTIAEWRHDIREFMATSETADDDLRNADDDVFNALFNHLRELGYVEVDDVAVDVFEGRITNERARLMDDPSHEEQPDGFGHFGWESGRDEQERE